MDELINKAALALGKAVLGATFLTGCIVIGRSLVGHLVKAAKQKLARRRGE